MSAGRKPIKGKGDVHVRYGTREVFEIASYTAESGAKKYAKKIINEWAALEATMVGVAPLGHPEVQPTDEPLFEASSEPGHFHEGQSARDRILSLIVDINEPLPLEFEVENSLGMTYVMRIWREQPDEKGRIFGHQLTGGET